MGMLSKEDYDEIRWVKFALMMGAPDVYVIEDIEINAQGVIEFRPFLLYFINLTSSGPARKTIGKSGGTYYPKIAKRIIRHYEIRKIFVRVDVNSEDIQVQRALGLFPESRLITHRVDKSKLK